MLALSLATGHGATIMAASGNLSDVQAAVNKAYPGDTITIPSGTYTWSGTLGITKSLVLQGARSNSTFIRRGSFFNDYNGLISISPPVNVSLVRITAIKFNTLNIGMNYHSLATISIWGPNDGSGISTNIRIDHCNFIGGVGAIAWNYAAYGVVDHCVFTDCVYALTCYGDGDQAWGRPNASAFGRSDNCVVAEDCTFKWTPALNASALRGVYPDCLTDCDRGGSLCMRHCTIDFTGFTLNGGFGSVIMMHGNSAPGTWNGSHDVNRGPIILEFYNNTVSLGGSSYRCIYLRGGRAAIHDNTFNGQMALVKFTEEEGYSNTAFPVAIRSTWPAEDQINNTFIWNNTLNGYPVTANDIGNWNRTDDRYIKQNRDWWLKAPDSTTATVYPQPSAPSLSNYPVNANEGGSPRNSMGYYNPGVTSYRALSYPHSLVNGFSPTPTPSSTISPAPRHRRLRQRGQK